ncbi:MAG: hypothetical protein Pg6C_04520 [Treponemataceae bacterium]|nr:MAG: hypothetical protein Pg6C_04520 [Treponemataceae bacterium]
MTIEQTIDIPASHCLTIEVPREVPAGRAQMIIKFPIPAAEKPAVLPRFTRAQIEEAVNSPDMQALLGALKGADLPPDISAKDIREMRLKEKYGI